jgi:hypothetical protein
MKYFLRLFTAILLILSFSCSSDDSDSSDDSGDTNLKLLKGYTKEENGQITELVNLVYEGDKIIELVSDFNSKISYEYENNLLVLEERFDYDFSSQQYNVFDDVTTFQYVDNILFSDKAVYDVDTDEHNKHKYSLLSNGKISQYDFYQDEDVNNPIPPGGSRIFTYNQNNVVLESQTNGNGNEEFRIERTFDDQNNPMRNVNIQSTRQIWALLLSPMSDNNMLTRNAYDNNDELYWSLSYTYQYDEDGYPISRETYNNLTQVIDEVLTFEYYE